MDLQIFKKISSLLKQTRRLLSSLSDFNIDTVGKFLSSSPIWLLTTAGCSFANHPILGNQFICPTLDSVKEVIREISAFVAPKPRTALDLHRAQRILPSDATDYDTIERWFLKTGVRDLDKLMGGGLSSKFITEISGPPGIGKTQFCMTTLLLSLTNSSSLVTDFSPPPSVIYIDTELKLDPGRLVQMAQHRYPAIYGTISTQQKKALDALLGRVKIIRPTSSKELQHEIEQLQAMAITSRAVLIIIDSVAALVRKEAMTERDREEFFMRQSVSLKRIAELCNCVVLVTNQASPGSGEEGGAGLGGEFGELHSMTNDWGTRMLPTLGPSWHHCVSVRLTMSRSNPLQQDSYAEVHSRVEDNNNSGEGARIGYVTVTKSPGSGPLAVPFKIGVQGVQNLEI